MSVAIIFILLRIGSELLSARLFGELDNVPVVLLVIQWSLWYSGTIIATLACFRHIGQVPLRKAYYLLLGTPLTVLPIVIGILRGTGTPFAYLSYHEPGLLLSVATLMYASPTNHYMFYEFLIIAIVVPIVTYLFTRRILRSVATALGMYLALIFAQGFIYLCSDPGQCVFGVGSGIPIYVFLCLYLTATVAGWLCVLLWPELRRYMQAGDTVFTQQNFAIALLLSIPYAMAALRITGYFFDLLFLLLAYFIFFYALLFLWKNWRGKRLLGLNLFLGIYSLLIMATLVCLLTVNSL